MRKLIFVNRYFYPDHSATSQMLTDLAFALAAGEDVEVHVVTGRQRYDDALANLPPYEEVGGVKVHRVWTSSFGRQELLGRMFDYLGFYLAAFVRLCLLAGRGDLVVAKTDPPLISVVAALAAKLKSATLVNWIQDLFPEVAAALDLNLVKGPVYGALRRLRNFSLNCARVNVAIGGLMKERLVGEGVPPERIQVIHNWADAEQIRPVPPAENPLRGAWGLDGKFVVGYSGNFGRGHDFDSILESATLLKDRRDIAFLLIGGGANRKRVEAEAARRGLSNIVFKPYQPREILAQSLSAADLHLISLKPELEGLIVPSKFYGVAAAGRPMLFIGAADGEIAGLIQSVGCGYPVEPGDAAALSRRICELAADPGLCAGMGGRARAFFDGGHTPACAARHWKALLNGMPAYYLADKTGLSFRPHQGA